MIKSELILRIAEENPHLYPRDVEAVVNTILATITAAMVRGERVELRGFGAFLVKHREARKGRNPRTGTAVAVGQKAVAQFRPGKEMRLRVQGGPRRDPQADAEHIEGSQPWLAQGR